MKKERELRGEAEESPDGDTYFSFTSNASGLLLIKKWNGDELVGTWVARSVGDYLLLRRASDPNQTFLELVNLKRLQSQLRHPSRRHHSTDQVGRTAGTRVQRTLDGRVFGS